VVNSEAHCRRNRAMSASDGTVFNRNALKHGMYVKAALEEQKELRSMIREMEESLREIEE
jgi:hypothetical protein